ncbi:PPE family protein [Amycolatopsis roodepoortensis]|uniref:PPE family protein n=1 Tax=Amycolatopsis roodepoortensis TaxID=700274 RepID=UPI00214AF391|nr:PPE family protein [Amycolatopsis roodepoortensis]UUV28473.1 PPE family protein [Amycolatopsis roodepoortensis]
MRILPMPWPPREPDPEPGPDSLYADIDYMTIPHRQLYEMVHNELDLASAEAVAGQWATIGVVLDRIGSELRSAIIATADGWTGEGAERARDVAIKLVDWASETSLRADNVANCVRRQADIAETARRTMPEPPGYAPRPKLPERPTRRPIPVADQDSTQAMSAASPSGGSFAEAGRIVAEPTDENAQDLHRQAADVMTRMQRSSGEVYEKVPQFVSYGEQPKILEKPEEPKPEPDPKPDPKPETPPDDSTSSSGVDDAAPIQVREPVETPRQPGASSGAVAPPPGVAGTAQDLGQGNRSGAGGFGPSGQQPGQVAGARAAAAGIGGVGGMPMGMMPPQGQQDNESRKSPGYLVEDSDVWGLGGHVTPPVIGEDPRTDR